MTTQMPPRTKAARALDFDDAPAFDRAAFTAGAGGGAGAGGAVGSSPAGKKLKALYCECAEVFTFRRALEFGSGCEPDPELTARTIEILSGRPISDEELDAVSIGVDKIIGETVAHERDCVEGAVSSAGPGYTMDHICCAPTYEADKRANVAKMTPRFHNIYRLARMIEEERKDLARAAGAPTDNVCYNCCRGCGSEREAMLERCIRNEWNHVRTMHILPEYIADPAEHDVADDDATVSTVEPDDDAADADDHSFAQRQSPVFDLGDADAADASEHSFEGALDLRPRPAAAPTSAAVGLVPGEFIDLDALAESAVTATAAAPGAPVKPARLHRRRLDSQRALDEDTESDDESAATTAVEGYTLRRDTRMPRLGGSVGGSAGAGGAVVAEAPAPVVVAAAGAAPPMRRNAEKPLLRGLSQYERPERFTRRAIERPHRLDDDLVARLAEASVKGRAGVADVPEEALHGAFRVLLEQEALEYAELGTTRDARAMASREEEQAYNAEYYRNYNAMVDRLLRIYVLCRMRDAEAARFAAADEANRNAVPDANGVTRFSIHMGVDASLYKAMIDNEWAAFDNMNLLPETAAKARARRA